MSDTLKPCPFCGGCAELRHFVDAPYIECIGCDAEGPVEHDDAAAIAAWNRRAANTATAPSQPVEQATKGPQRWNSGNEFLPFHPQASHVSPSYREGWNDCYALAISRMTER